MFFFAKNFPYTRRIKPVGLVVFSAAFDKPVSAKENTTSSRGRLYSPLFY